MKKIVSLLGIVIVCILLLMVSVTIESKKPVDPEPEPDEPFGELALTDEEQLAITNGQYVRLYNWDHTANQWKHVWTGDCVSGSTGVVIGDVDNDGDKELVVETSTVVIIDRKTSIITHYLKIWENGDHSNSPTFTTAVPYSGSRLEIGDVDEDSENELVVCPSWGIDIWDFASDDNGDVYCPTGSQSYRILKVGTYGLTVADCDNDGYDEIIVGGARDPQDPTSFDGRAVIIDKTDTGYSKVALIGSRSIDDISVGDLDENIENGNEIFMSGATGGLVFIWRYQNGQYVEIWRGTYDVTRPDLDSGSFGYLQSNEIADIDGDGYNEALSGLGLGYDRVKNKYIKWSRTFIWSYSGEATWTCSYYDHNDPIGQLYSMVSGDPDGDGCAEVVYDGVTMEWSSGTLVNPQSLPFRPPSSDLSIG